MGSRLGAIGIPALPDPSFREAIQRLVGASSVLGDTADGGTTVLVYDDDSGSRITLTSVAGRVECITPTYQPGSILGVSVGSLAAADCPFERPLLLDILDADGELIYPLPVTIEDLAVSAAQVPTGERAQVELVALAERISVYADEAAFRADDEVMATESLIPSGMFSLTDPSSDVSSRMLMRGTVLSAELRRHALFDWPFAVLSVRSYGANYVVCCDVDDLGGATAPQLPAAGNIVSGEFWLSGRLLPTTGGVA